MNGMPELLAPGGSLQAALYALSYGADGVYVGLPDFSAQKKKKNLTQDELLRLIAFAMDRGKKIYIAMNTIILERELERVCSLLYDVSMLPVAGIIVQDYGLFALIKDHFPWMPIHGSTQMAVHNTDGVRFLASKGFSRIIVSRELTFEELAVLRKEHRDIELEVFIHGSLCYGMSGLCLASGIMVGRSGNRGECAQICRSWFDHGKQRGYYFSCNDLRLGTSIRKLSELGIDAFKIEGRMKSPEYSGLVSAYYRAILDGKPDETIFDLEKQCRQVFSRRQTQAYFYEKRGKHIINKDYPSHRGLFLGTVKESRGNFVSLTIKEPLALHDGILVFGKGEHSEPAGFSVQILEQNGKRVFSAEQGTAIRLQVPFPVSEGSRLYKASSHKLLWPMIQEPNPFRIPVPVSVTLDGSIMRTAAKFRDIEVCTQTSVTVEPANKTIPFIEVLAKHFSTPVDSRFTIASIEFVNRGEGGDTGIFIPPSELKSAKNRLFASLETAFRKQKAESVSAALFLSEAPVGPAHMSSIPRRSSMRCAVPAEKAIRHELPFITEYTRLSLANLTAWSGMYFLPLCPAIFDSRGFFERLSAFLGEHRDKRFCIGLSNPAHLAWAQHIPDNATCFIDYGLYIANRFAFKFFEKELPHLEFAYFWIEGSDEDFEALVEHTGISSPPLLRYEKDFSPPLFISRCCFRRHSIASPHASGCQPDACGKRFEYRISQQKRQFNVVVESCMSYVTETR